MQLRRRVGRARVKVGRVMTARRQRLLSPSAALVMMAVGACSAGVACSSSDAGTTSGAPVPGVPDDAASPPTGGGDGGRADGTAAPGLGDDLPWSAGLETCGNGKDDDGDGLIDEDCAPSFFIGVFPPSGGADLGKPVAAGGHVARMEADMGRPISVVQTYRAANAIDTARVRVELGEIWGHGAVAHLYVEPAGYSPSQYANAGTDPAVGADLEASARAIADALAMHPKGRLLLSFGAEMNGNWTDWGCKNASAAAFVAASRKMHAAVAAALVAKKIDPRRVRWVYAPNATSSGGSCGSAAAYYPGHDAVDFIGFSAYRTMTESVASAVVTPAKELLADLAYPASWQRDRFIVLQTGSKTNGGDARGTWLKSLIEDLAADPVFAGVIPFDLSDADPLRDWALLDLATPAAARSGYDAFIAAAKALPRSDGALDGTFEPYFWDVRMGDPSYAEIQALRGAKITSGCSAAPPLFCADASITRAEAAAFLAGAFGATTADADATLGAAPVASVRRGVLAAALTTLLKVKRPLAKKDLARLADDAKVEPERNATRAEAAAWIVHTARIAPAPRP